MNLGKGVRTALIAPVMIASGLLVLTLGSTDVLAASSTSAAATPQTSSKPHKHESVTCVPGKVSENKGQCQVVFYDPWTKDLPNPIGQKVCFLVLPNKAGHVGTGAGTCAHVGNNHRAYATFTASGNYCGLAKIRATEPGHTDSHHTTITITCKKDATTTAALLPAGSPQPPVGGLLVGGLGLAGAIFTGFALNRRTLAPWRLAAGKSA
jgi:hypothetical protein